MCNWSCCKGCTMGCGGVWFGRQLGLPTFCGEAHASESRKWRQQFSLKIWQTYVQNYTASYSAKLTILIFVAVRIPGHMSFLHKKKRCWLRLWSICLSPFLRSARGRCMMHRLYLHHVFSYISWNYAEIVNSICGQWVICAINLELGTVQHTS